MVRTEKGVFRSRARYTAWWNAYKRQQELTRELERAWLYGDVRRFVGVVRDQIKGAITDGLTVGILDYIQEKRP